ncbi:MAG: hybrid sensor histidine kinase/response regulator [Polyangiaceae bacterium]
MSSGPPEPSGAEARLERCIRDLTAITAIPAMCLGRGLRDALDVLLEALPAALESDLVFVELPRGRRAASLGGEKLGPAAVAHLAALLEGAAPNAAIQTDAGPRFVLVAEFPVDGDVGRLVVGRIDVEDRTDRVLTRTAANLVGGALETARVLEEARLKDSFLAVLGHELRNPLGPIYSGVELLARAPEVAREREIIGRSARHLGRLVDDLLDMSRMARGEFELRREVVVLQDVLDQARVLAEPLMKRARHVLTAEDAAGLTVHGDPVRLVQVLGNLLTNAAKFTPAGGHVRVGIVRQRDCVRVSVEDDGRGIPADEQQRIFEPFFQIDRAADSQRGGLGLGLAIARDLVVRHGGTIRVTSEGPGRGSTFIIELPLAEGSTPAQPPLPSADREAGHGKRILIVDDNADLAELLSLALEQRGFEIAVAHDAPSALELWRSFTPDAAILDLGLPGRDGLALARDIRNEHGLRPALIVASGYGRRRDLERATEAGFDRYFVKPVSIAELAPALNDCIAERRRLVSSVPDE